MTQTVARRDLAQLSTADLIAQYNQAISSYAGRCTNASPRQRRIDYIVDLLSQRADDDDQAALAWFEI